MTNTFRMLMLTGALAGAFAVSTGAAAKEITVALASTFTTMDPYDAGDTLSQPENRGIYTQSDSPKKSSRNIWSLHSGLIP